MGNQGSNPKVDESRLLEGSVEELDFGSLIGQSFASFGRHGCDGCGQVIESDTHWHCSECTNFDLCDLCYHQRDQLVEAHPMDHYFSRDRCNPREVHTALQDKTLREALAYILQAYPTRRCFGYRQQRSLDVQWVNYAQVLSRSSAIAAALSHFAPRTDYPFVSLCSANVVEWFLADFACCLQGFPTVPLYTTMSASAFCEILQETHTWCLFTTSALAARLLDDQYLLPELRLVVLIDNVLPAFDKSRLKTTGVMTLSQLEELGKEKPALEPLEESDIFTLIYTSGSTGSPKGTIMPPSSWLNSLMRGVRFIQDPLVDVSFTPLAHSSGRRFVWADVWGGGRCFLFDTSAHSIDSENKGLSYLLEDCQEVGPQSFVSTPRLWNHLYSLFSERVEALGDRSAALKEFSTILGSRLSIIAIGGAPSSPDVQRWMAACFKVRVTNGYGITETGGVAGGGVSSNGTMTFQSGVKYKLRSVPELGYYETDGKGELCVRTPTQCTGYWNSPALTAKAFSSDGYFATGDIVEITKNGFVRLIDRAKHIVKLAQGEFVALEKLEQVFLSSEIIDQICVEASSLRSFILAVVVPNYPVLYHRLGSESPTDLQVEQAILSDIARLALKSELQGYEVPKGVILTKINFTVENDELTGSFKVKRRSIYAHYEDEIQALARSLAGVRLRVQELLQEAVKAPAGTGFSFKEMGGDSVSAIRLVNVIREELQVDVPISMLLGGAPMDAVADFVESHAFDQNLSTSAAGNFDFSEITRLPAQWKFPIAKGSEQKPTNILLTGATGFLGMHLLVELVQRLSVVSPQSYFIVLIVRGGVTRLKAKLSRASIKIPTDFWDHHSMIMEGDVSESRFGLDDEQWKVLSETIHLVIHNAALVNSALSIHQLIPTNTLSVKTCVELCASKGEKGQSKRMLYVSSAGCIYGFVKKQVDTEGRLMNGWNSSLTNMGGYTLSKLIGEQICHNARDRGLDCRIVRPSTISHHSISGFGNADDTMHRILQAVLQQKSYPVLREGASCINCVPVDWVASSAVDIAFSASAREVTNLVRQGKSLDWKVIFDWLQELLPDLCPLEFLEWKAKMYEEVTVESSHPLRAITTNFGSSFPYRGDLYPHISSSVEAPKITGVMFQRGITNMFLENPKLIKN